MKYEIKTKDLSDLWDLIADTDRHKLSEYAFFLQDFANRVLLDADNRNYAK